MAPFFCFLSSYLHELEVYLHELEVYLHEIGFLCDKGESFFLSQAIGNNKNRRTR